MKRLVSTLVVAFFGFGIGVFSAAVLPDWETAIGVTNVSHYPPILVVLSGVCGAIAFGLLGYFWSEQ